MPFSSFILSDGSAGGIPDPVGVCPVRISLLARQTTLNPPFGAGWNPSLFGLRPGGVPPKDTPEEITPENAPEALDYALEEIIDRDSDGYGFSPADGEEDGAFDSDEESGGDDDGAVGLWEALESIVRSLGEPEEEDSVLIRTLGRMEKRILPGGYVRLDIRYEEADSEDLAETAVTLDSRDPGLITVSRHGMFTSMIVCEEGVRHVTAYQTPFGTMELAVMAKRCESTVSFAQGGVIELDYLVELHGTDLQYSQLRIDVSPAD